MVPKPIRPGDGSSPQPVAGSLPCTTPGRPWLALGATILGTFILTLAALAWVNRPREADLADLIAALPNPRPFVARLSGGFPYAPCERAEVGEDEIPKLVCATPPASQVEPARLGQLEKEFLRHARRQPEARQRHLSALWTLAAEGTRGNLDRAIEDLEVASKLDPDNGAILSDLAAALTARAAKTDDTRDLVRALDAAERAAQASPDLPEALWNRAVAREIWDVSAANPSWAQLRDAETSPDWALAPETLRSLQAALPPASSSEVLAASLLAQVAAELASNVDSQLANALVYARSALVRGLAAFENADYIEAQVSFRAAAEPLAELQPVLAGWARYWELRAAYRRGLYREVLQAAPAHLAAAGESDPALVAGLLWVLSSTQSALGLTTDALAAQQEALEYARRAGHRQIEGCLHTRLAGTLESLGRSREAWRHRLLGLRALGAGVGDPELATALAEAVHGALNLGALHAAIALQAAELMHSQASGEPLRWMLALQHRAELVARLTPTAASELLASARREATVFPNQEVRALLLAQLDLTGASLARANDHAAAAVMPATRAVDFFRLSNQILLPAALLERSLVHRRLANSAAAETDLLEAAEAAEDLAALRQAPSERAAAIDQLEVVFQELLALKIQQGEEAEALSVLERSRARELLEWLAQPPEAVKGERSIVGRPLARPLRHDELGSRLDKDAIFVVYQTLGKELPRLGDPPT